MNLTPPDRHPSPITWRGEAGEVIVYSTQVKKAIIRANHESEISKSKTNSKVRQSCNTQNYMILNEYNMSLLNCGYF